MRNALKLTTPTDREIVVYCHLGAGSAYITKKLNALGYDRAMNLIGGLDAWRLSRLPQ